MRNTHNDQLVTLPTGQRLGTIACFGKFRACRSACGWVYRAELKRRHASALLSRIAFIDAPGSLSDSRRAYRLFRSSGHTEAVIRIDGVARGAFDAVHRTVVVSGALAGELALEDDPDAASERRIAVGERRTFVCEPSGARKREHALFGYASDPESGDGDAEALAMRTFASAVRQLELDPSFAYVEPRTSRYESVLARDPALFGRVVNLVRAGRFDASSAALWGARDRPFAAGETLLRQLAFGIRFAERELGVTPTIAWFSRAGAYPQILPTLLVHAGIARVVAPGLATHERFSWQGPDGSGVVVVTSSADARFVTDGAGGISDRTLMRAPRRGTWRTLGGWVAERARDAAAPPIVCESLVSRAPDASAHPTFDDDVREARLDALARELVATETLLAWAYALRATPFFLDEARGQLDRAWRCAARERSYPNSAARCAEAEALVRHVAASAQSVLPTARRRLAIELVPPVAVCGGFAFENEALRAVVRRDGALVSLATPGGPNLVRAAARLAFRDGRSRGVRAAGCALVDGGLEVRFAFGRSLAVARYSLEAREPFVRVTYAIAWREGRRASLHDEASLAFRAERTRLGAPHGALDAHARIAVGSRFARFDGPRGGLAVLRSEPSAWTLRSGHRNGRSGFAQQLVCGAAPVAGTEGEGDEPREIALAFAPFASLGMGELETMWERFASEPAVPMFVSNVPNVVVVATKLADDGAGVIVRARECDGAATDVRFACGARVLGVACVDALERPTEGDAAIDDGEIHARFAPFTLRSFRVRLR